MKRVLLKAVSALVLFIGATGSLCADTAGGRGAAQMAGGLDMCNYRIVDWDANCPGVTCTVQYVQIKTTGSLFFIGDAQAACAARTAPQFRTPPRPIETMVVLTSSLVLSSGQCV